MNGIPKLSAIADTSLTTPLDRCLGVYREWLDLPNTDPVVAAIGGVAANLMPGDPLWLMLVGPPGSGKTEVIAPVGGLSYVHPAATVTEAALLSGTAQKERETGATGGLLRQVGEFGIILVRDFSGVLAMHREARAELSPRCARCTTGSGTDRSVSAVDVSCTGTANADSSARAPPASTGITP